MAPQCRIPNAVEKILAASHCNVAYIGGSLTVGVGASNTAETSWRALFTQYLYQTYHPRYHCQISEIMGAIGACESYVAAFTLGRNVLPALPDLALVEFCVNDQSAPDKPLVRKGMEGIVRQLRSARNTCDVMILGMGQRDRPADDAIHREVAEHYGLPFVDVHSYLVTELGRRGQTWDDITIEFEQNDPHHLNDYGQQLCFEAIRECFEEQLERFQAGHRRPRRFLPEPMLSDELEFARLIDPARPTPDLTLSGEWAPAPPGRVPWYFDHLTVGPPGAELTFEFDGTAVAVFGLMYNNGLTLQAELDGRPVRDAYLRFFIEFGKGFVLAHGLEGGRHVLRLTVSPPSRRHNKLESPAAAIGYLGVAGRSG